MPKCFAYIVSFLFGPPLSILSHEMDFSTFGGKSGSRCLAGWSNLLIFILLAILIFSSVHVALSGIKSVFVFAISLLKTSFTS